MQMMKLYLLILVRMIGLHLSEVDIRYLFREQITQSVSRQSSVQNVNGISILQHLFLQSSPIILRLMLMQMGWFQQNLLLIG